MSTAVPSISPSNEISKSTAILATNDDINNNNKCSTSEFITNEMSPKQQQQQHHHQMAIINEHGDNINHESKIVQPLAQILISYIEKLKNFSINKTTMATFLRRSLITIFMAIFISVVQTYTWITLPIYFILQKPWLKRKLNARNRVKIYKPSPSLTVPSIKSESINSYHHHHHNNNYDQLSNGLSLSPIYIRDDCGEYNHPIFKFETLTEIVNNIPNLYGPDVPCLGYRQVLSEEVALDSQGQIRRMDGRQLKQYHLSDYKWLTYSQVNDVTNNIAQGLIANGINELSRVMIISETRIEWMLCFQSLLRCNATLATVFSNLGVDGVAHGIEETEVETVIVSLECITLLKSALCHAKKHSVKRIIYMDGLQKPEIDIEESIKTFALSDIEKIGKQLIEENRQQPYPSAKLDKTMLIMYTSGTTGLPKAATMTQRQFLGSIRALFVLVRHIIHEAPFHTYISYLPMAHVLELTLEVFFCVGGVRLGYASPFTLTDSAPGLARGQKPDIKLLRPTVMTTVPLVLDRIIKEVNDKLRSRTPVSQPVFQFLMNYKSMWTRLGYRCDIVSKLLCTKVREQLGSNLHFVICGGAPLNSNTQATIKSALDVTLIQGYGATETTGAVLCMDFDDLEYGRVGAPLGHVYFRLRDWPDGGYSVKDKPNPRGEILIGGDLVAINYFKRPEQSNEVFITDQNGIRWFQTGDVGELYPNGTIKIIDRCKDLIKLQNGEYISLGKVEAALKFCQLVDNICVYGGTFSNDIVALISPNRKALEQLAQTIGKNHLSIEEQCNDQQIQQIIFDEIMKTAKQLSLGKKEIPRRVRLVPEIWSPDNGILTAALKLKRRIVEQMYKQQLYDLYNAKKFNLITTNGYDQNNNNNNNNIENNNNNNNSDDNNYHHHHQWW
nr:LOW QUALITY PROTEIN: long chain acyl-CoA synthetase 9, chloroplastic-like [Dermatophagoides farinae]